MDQKPAGRLTPSVATMDSPKKACNPSTSQSSWSFGWQGGQDNHSSRANDSKGFNTYHNKSSISFGEEKSAWQAADSKPSMMKKEVQPDRPVWNYNPKTAGMTTMVLGTQKPDYRKKDEVYKERTLTALT